MEIYSNNISEHGTYKVHILDLSDDILLNILVMCPYNSESLSLTCKRLKHLWSLSSTRANWILYNMSENSKTQALDLAISYFRDLKVAKNIVDRFGKKCMGSVWLTHAMVDVCRGIINDHEDHSMDTSLLNNIERLAQDNIHNFKFVSSSHHSDEQDSSKYSLIRKISSDFMLNCQNYNYEIQLNQKSNESYIHNTPALLEALLNAGADHTLNVILYLKSLLFGTPSLSSNYQTGLLHPSVSSCLPWIINESHRLSNFEPGESTENNIRPLNLSKRKNNFVSAGSACLYFLCVTGETDAMHTLFSTINNSGNATKLDVSDLDNLAICIACTCKYEKKALEVVKILVGQGADPNARSSMPLKLAQNSGFEKLAKYISSLKKG